MLDVVVRDLELCGKCGSDRSRVINSRRREDGVWRRRECVVCKFRHNTIERPDDPADEEHKLRLFLARIDDTMTRLDDLSTWLKALRRQIQPKSNGG
jgi:transposase